MCSIKCVCQIYVKCTNHSNVGSFYMNVSYSEIVYQKCQTPYENMLVLHNENLPVQ